MTNYNYNINVRSQRGAMFGLDARLALAIFAGLSVIAGMAVFDVIRETNVSALTSEFDNYSKAYTNYTFDTGQDVPTPATPGAGEGIQAFFEDTSPATLNWNGPYVTRSTADHPKFGTYTLDTGFIDVAGEDPTSTTGGNITGAWLALSDVPCQLAESVDEAIDGEPADNEAGNFRYPTTCASTGTVYYLLSRQMS